MKSIKLIEIEPGDKSIPVAAAKMVLVALIDEYSNSILIEDNDLSELDWGEMKRYLLIRGITVYFDYDLMFPVAIRL